jgi:hypothetical protein
MEGELKHVQFVKCPQTSHAFHMFPKTGPILPRDFSTLSLINFSNLNLLLKKI